MTNAISGGFNSVSMSQMREKIFKKMDSGGDGKIDKNEMKAFQSEEEKISGRSGPDTDKIFEEVDTDKDGAISQAEDEAQFEKMKEAMKNGPRGMGGKPPMGPPPPMKGAGKVESGEGDDEETSTAKTLLKMLKELEKTLTAKTEAARNSSSAEETMASGEAGDAGDSTMKTLLDMIEKLETAEAARTQKTGEGTDSGPGPSDSNYVIKSAISAYMQNNSSDPQSFSGTINIQIRSMYA